MTEPIISAMTANGKLSFSFLQDCEISIEMKVFEDGVKSLCLETTEALGKELLIILNSLYGMEDYEASVRFTQEQYKFLDMLAESQEMSIEDVLRDMVQKRIDS